MSDPLRSSLPVTNMHSAMEAECSSPSTQGSQVQAFHRECSVHEPGDRQIDDVESQFSPRDLAHSNRDALPVNVTERRVSNTSESSGEESCDDEKVCDDEKWLEAKAKTKARYEQDMLTFDQIINGLKTVMDELGSMLPQPQSADGSVDETKNAL